MMSFYGLEKLVETVTITTKRTDMNHRRLMQERLKQLKNKTYTEGFDVL